jgi:multidrug efflux pump
MLAAAQPITDYLSTALAVVLFLFTCRKYFPKVQDFVSSV